MENKKNKVKNVEEIDKRFEILLKKVKQKDRELIKKAYDFAKEKHKKQKRKSGEPYLIHPFEVFLMVLELGLDKESMIAALLHDVVEDCNDVNIEIIKEEFGEEVANIVDSLTKIKHYGDNKKVNNVEGYKKILLASVKDVRVLIIKILDRLHNMRTLKYHYKKEKIEKIAQETLDIFAPIAQKLGLYEIKWELEDLSFRYLNPEMYYYIKDKIKLKRAEREEVVKKLVTELEILLKKKKIKFTKIIGRPKSFYSIYKKIKDKSRNLENIYDLYAIRIITKEISDCYHVLYFIHQNFNVFPNRLKDYIATPKSNGYQSIHTVIFSDLIKYPVEIQIRTEEMHKIAEFGVAAHWRYKNLRKDKKFEKKINWLREIREWTIQNDEEEFLKLLKIKFFEDEIFLFTPKNDIITLPEGSTPIDFAYSIHTDIGNTAIKAKVNGEVVSLDRKLKNGDIVEIVTDKKSKPNEKWLKFVKTSKARVKIREALNIKHSGKQVEDLKGKESILKNIVFPDNYKKFKKAGCCSIKKGDNVVGVVNKEKELVIHNANCENAKYSLNKKILLKWKKEKEKPVTLNILSEDRIGWIMDLLSILNSMNVSIEKVNSKSMKNNKFKMSITFRDLGNVEKIEKEIKKIDGVISVSKSKPFFSF